MAKVDVFLDHAARYLMATPESVLFTNSLPPHFQKARIENSSGHAQETGSNATKISFGP
jgi:hypothetical protein